MSAHRTCPSNLPLMDLNTAMRIDEGSPNLFKRSVELKRRSIEPESLPATSAPKLHCTFSAKLVDQLSNFSIVNEDALAEIEEPPALRGSDCSDADADAVPTGAAPPAARADDTCSAISEQAALSGVAEPVGANTDDDAASSPTKPADSSSDEETAITIAAVVPAPSAACAPFAHRPKGLAAVFESFGARSIPSAAPADVAAAARAHLKEHPSVCMDTLYVYDLAQVARMHAAWVAALPRVRPYYGECSLLNGPQGSSAVEQLVGSWGRAAVEVGSNSHSLHAAGCPAVAKHVYCQQQEQQWLFNWWCFGTKPLDMCACKRAGRACMRLSLHACLHVPALHACMHA